MRNRIVGLGLISFLIALLLCGIAAVVVVAALRAQPPTPADQRVVEVSPTAAQEAESVVIPAENSTSN